MNKIIYLGLGILALPFAARSLFNAPSSPSDTQIVVERSDEIDQAEQATLEQYQATKDQLAAMPSELALSTRDALLSNGVDQILESDKALVIEYLKATADQFLQEARTATQTEGVSTVAYLSQKCYSISDRAADQAIASGLQQYSVTTGNREPIRAYLTDSYACALAIDAANRGQSTIPHAALNPGVWAERASLYSQIYTAQIAATQPATIPDLNSEVASNER